MDAEFTDKANEACDAKQREDALRRFKLGELMPYADIFRKEAIIKLNMSGQEYEVIDSYCVNPQCNCTDTGLFFFKLPRTRYDDDFSFLLNYRTKKAEQPLKMDEGEAEKIALSLPEEVFNMFSQRRKKLKENIRPEIEEKLSKYYNNRNVAGKLVKLGRNKPCHCGSGKKYKKCCLDKDIEKYGGHFKVMV